MQRRNFIARMFAALPFAAALTGARKTLFKDDTTLTVNAVGNKPVAFRINGMFRQNGQLHLYPPADQLKATTPFTMVATLDKFPMIVTAEGDGMLIVTAHRPETNQKLSATARKITVRFRPVSMMAVQSARQIEIVGEGAKGTKGK